MPIQTYAEQLEEVQTAISRILAGAQSYTTINGRSLTRADLRTLQERETYLRAQVDRETRGGVRVRYGVTR